MEIIAEKREKLGKKAQSLKADRKIPAVLFGKGLISLPLSVDTLMFSKVFNTAGETSLIDLDVSGKKEKVLIKDVQWDPVSLAPIHASFYKVNLKEKITANIPVEAIGEMENPLLKTGNALVLVLLNDITVEALPADLPNKFEIDVSKMVNIDDVFRVGDLNYDRTKVEIVDNDDDEIVLKIENAQMQETKEDVADAAAAAAAETEAEAIAKVAATKELSEEEKAKRAEEAKNEKAAKEKEKKK